MLKYTLVLIFFYQGVFAQETNVKNNCSACCVCNITYEVVRESIQLTDSKIKPSRYLIQIKNIPIEYFFQNNRSELLNLLETEECGWEANLVLYALEEKEAIALISITEEEWKLDFRDKDIEYWKKEKKADSP